MASTALNFDHRSNSVSSETLANDNARFHNTGGISAKNYDSGFAPAYREKNKGQVVRSRFADGKPAPIHVLEGIPEDWVAKRDPDGSIQQLKESIEAGFLRDGDFFTREQAAAACAAANVDDIRDSHW